MTSRLLMRCDRCGLEREHGPETQGWFTVDVTREVPIVRLLGEEPSRPAHASSTAYVRVTQNACSDGCFAMLAACLPKAWQERLAEERAKVRAVQSRFGLEVAIAARPEGT